MHIWQGKEGFNEYDVYLDGVKQHYVFEANEEEGKLWKNIKLSDGTFKTIGMSEELAYEMLTGNVEIRKTTPQDKRAESSIGFYSSGMLTYERCDNPYCIICNDSDDTSTLNIAADTINFEGVQEYIQTDTIDWAHEIEGDYIDYGYELPTAELTFEVRSPKAVEVTGAMINDTTFAFDTPVNMASGDILELSIEVAGDGITINSVSVIRKQ